MNYDKFSGRPNVDVNPFYTPGKPEFGVSVLYDQKVLLKLAEQLREGTHIATAAEVFDTLPTEAELTEPSRKDLDQG